MEHTIKNVLDKSDAFMADGHSAFGSSSAQNNPWESNLSDFVANLILPYGHHSSAMGDRIIQAFFEWWKPKRNNWFLQDLKTP